MPGTKLTCRVDNLVAGTVVQFNVIASNGVGDSKPSDTSPMYYVIGERETLKSLFFLYISFFRPSKTAKEALVSGVYCAELHP